MLSEIFTFNIQRDHSGNVVPDIQGLAKEYPNAIICLQEVTEEIGRRIAEVFPTSVQREENMIIVPENLHIDDVQSLSYGRRTRTFLQAEISQGDDSPFFLVTGKLRHGLSFAERYKVLRDMFRFYFENPSLLALDTNHLIPGESRIVLGLLRRYGFTFTDHPEGTYDMRRMEHAFGKIIPQSFARSQLDRIFFSSHFMPQSSRVLTDIVTSDHEPVRASYKKI